MGYQKNTPLRIFCLLFLATVSCSVNAFSQKPGGKFPSFRIALTDSSYYTSCKLKKTPVLFVYFKPDCDECKAFTANMLTKIKELKKVQIVMITNVPLHQVKNFERGFSIKKYPIVLGTEGYTMTFLRQFNIQQFPFVMLYNKNGLLVKQYANTAAGIFDKILADVNSLQ